MQIFHKSSRETVLEQPRAGQPQQPTAYQQQFSTGTASSMVTPSDSTFILAPDQLARNAQSEDDAASFGTWLSAANLGRSMGANQRAGAGHTPHPTAAAQASTAAHKAHAARNPQPAAARVQATGGHGESQGKEEEVSRRSERWSREEYYPEGGTGGPGYHKVTKEDYVIEEVVESAPNVVQTTRTIYQVGPKTDGLR